jgi:hypothetical protein
MVVYNQYHQQRTKPYAAAVLGGPTGTGEPAMEVSRAVAGQREAWDGETDVRKVRGCF